MLQIIQEDKKTPTIPKKLNVRYIKKNITVINIARNKLAKVCFFVFTS